MYSFDTQHVGEIQIFCSILVQCVVVFYKYNLKVIYPAFINTTYKHIFNDILGLNVVEDLPIVNVSDRDIEVSCSLETLEKIKELYKRDYELLGSYF